MVTEIDDDGDGYVLERPEIVGPDVPMVATLDLHANISPRMVELADVLIGYDTYPHIDMAERAHEASAVLARLMRGEIHPTPALRKPPMLPTSQRMTTESCRCGRSMERAHVMEEDPRVVNVTIAGGFPPGDNQDAGFSVVTTNDDPDLAAGWQTSWPRRRVTARRVPGRGRQLPARGRADPLARQRTRRQHACQRSASPGRYRGQPLEEDRGTASSCSASSLGVRRMAPPLLRARPREVVQAAIAAGPG